MKLQTYEMFREYETKFTQQLQATQALTETLRSECKSYFTNLDTFDQFMGQQLDKNTYFTQSLIDVQHLADKLSREKLDAQKAFEQDSKLTTALKRTEWKVEQL